MKRFPGESKKAVTMIELMLVLAIVAFGTIMVIPQMRKSVEHREAKAVLESLKDISHAIRLYELNIGTVPSLIQSLESQGYLDADRLAPGYTYTIYNVAQTVYAQSATRSITLKYRSSDALAEDGWVQDSGDYWDS